MALYKYFKPCKKESCNIVLPNPSGSLSKELDSAVLVIEEANKEASQLVKSTGETCSVFENYSTAESDSCKIHSGAWNS